MFTPTRIENADSLVADVNRIQDDLQAEFERLAPFTFENPTLVTGISLTTSDTGVAHGLGQRVRGYIIVKRSANAVVFDGAVAAAAPKNFISLQASAAVTVDIIFF